MAGTSRAASIQPASIPARALASTEKFAELEAVVDGEARITFATLGEDIVRSTRAAIAAGIRPGDRAAIWAPNCYPWVVASLGILGAGGVIVPMSTRFKGAEASYALAASHAEFLFVDNGFLDTDYTRMLRDWLAANGEVLPALRETVVFAGPCEEATSWADFLARGEAVAEADAHARIDAIGPDDLSDILFTSGTTGRPKGVMNAHGPILRLWDSWADIVGLGPGDRHLVATPFFHTTGYKSGWLVSIMRGATTLPVSVFDVPTVMRTVETERITFLPGPPSLLQDILHHPDRAHHDLSSLRVTITGAADIPVPLIEGLRDDHVFETIFTGYGLTETNGPVSISRRDDDAHTIANFSGRTMPDTELRIVGPDNNELPRGDVGEIVVRGFHVMRGYLDDPESTAAAIDADGWLHTGDVGTMDDRGYITITGRIKDMYIVGGFNAYPAEIENLLLRDKRIAQVAVVGVPDRRLGEVGMAFVVPRPGATLAAEDVIAWAREHMTNYKAPRYVEFCEMLPTNAMGKVQKDELRDRGRAHVEGVTP